MKTFFLTFISMTAFAANSILCKMALGSEEIGATGFTVIRLISGAITLILLNSFINGVPKQKTKKNYISAIALFIYAATFSYAYITLDTGTGALILFGAVQLTMLLYAEFSGDSLSFYEWSGVIVAFAGFLYLILPQINTPSIWGFILMSFSGIAWGIYTLKGKQSKNSLLSTSQNFSNTIPLVILLAFFIYFDNNFSAIGITLAILSGSVASGIGYAIWYKAILGLKTTEAAVVQLSVPILAAIGGIIFIGETFSVRLAIASSLVLGGILITIMGKKTV